MIERPPLSEPAPPAPAPPAPALPKRPKSRIWRAVRMLFGLVFSAGLIGGIAAGAVGYHQYEKYAEDLPTLDSLRHYQPRVMSRVYAGDSHLVAELATERRIFVPVAAIPDLVKQAFLSAEDQKFWSHHGIDPLAIARAGLTDVMQYGSGRRPVGASTITQQVAKNMLLGNEVSIARKVKELILATRIDTTLSKQQVLELYLNEIYLGLQAYGVAAAAQTYFNKGLDELTLPEAAFLAALPKAPNNYNPFRFPDAAKARRDWVIERMVEDHAVTPEDGAHARAEPILPAAFRRPETVPGAEWFAEEVRRGMIERFGADTTTQGGLTIRTSLDPAMQIAADQALRRGLLAYDRGHGGWRGPVSHAELSRLDGTMVGRGWVSKIAGVPRPPGMLPEWRLAIVIEVTNDAAQLGWVERSVVAAGTAGGVKNGTLYLSDVGWARPARGEGFGPAPRRMGDVVTAGDLVMIEPQDATPGRGLDKPNRLLLRQIPQVQGALVSMDPATGRVLALSGGWSFETSQFNRAVQAERQPGSSFKPFVYLSALQAGFSPSQRVLDAPFVQVVNGVEWKPNNYGLKFNGPTPMRLALERSLNLVTVRLAEKVGMDAVADNAIAFHVVDGMPRVLPAALGAVETTVLRQAAAYAGLAMGGKEVLPSLVDTVQDRDGHVLWRAPGLTCRGCDRADRTPGVVDQRKQVADPQSVFQVVTMMQGVVARGTGFAAGQGLGRAIAGKTGTSQDFNDAWFVGFTPDLVTAVWVGFDNNTSLGEKETGGGVSAPIFHEYMASVLKGRPNLQFRMPDGVKLAAWDSGAGRLTDGFKPDQVPGASQGTIGVAESGFSARAGGTGGPSAGVDSGMGGLY